MFKVLTLKIQSLKVQKDYINVVPTDNSENIKINTVLVPVY